MIRYVLIRKEICQNIVLLLVGNLYSDKKTLFQLGVSGNTALVPSPNLNHHNYMHNFNFYANFNLILTLKPNLNLQTAV